MPSSQWLGGVFPADIDRNIHAPVENCGLMGTTRIGSLNHFCGVTVCVHTQLA